MLKCFYRRMLAQDVLYDMPLNSGAAAMNNAHFLEAALDCLIKVLFHNYRNILRQKSVKVDGVLDRDFVHNQRI